MGAVYLARDTLLQRDVALKIPRRSDEQDPDAVARFFREARSAARLSHPGLCPVFDFGEIEGTLFLAMPFMPGKSLAEVLRSGQLLFQRQAVEITLKLTAALQAAHDAGVLHRDLKPANVMFNERDEPIVMDFGLAQIVQQEDMRLTLTGAFLGTPAYASPEQLKGNLTELTPASDVYSLGVMLFQMLTGRLPFEGSIATIMKQVLVDPPPRPLSLRADLHPELERICLVTLAKQPSDRYHSMSALATALEAIAPALADLHSPAAATVILPPQRGTNPKTSRGGWYLGCAAVSLFILGCPGLCIGVGSLLPPLMTSLESDLRPDPDWEDIASFWHPPTDLPDFSTLSLPGCRFVRQEELSELPGYEIKTPLPLRHAVLSHGRGEVDAYVCRASELERQAIYRRVEDIIQQAYDEDFQRDQDFDTNPRKLPPYPHYPSRMKSGSAESRFLRYRFRQDFQVPGDAAVFWWDEDWLFVVRSPTETDPRFVLRDLLIALNSAPR